MAYVQDIAAIAGINRQIAGLNAVYDTTNMPQQINVVPCAITVVAPASWSKVRADEYVIRVYVAPTQNGNPATSYSLCAQLLDAFFDVYATIATINGRPLLRAAHGHSNSPQGLGTSGFYYTQLWGANSFYGFEVFLPLGPTGPMIVPSVDA